MPLHPTASFPRRLVGWVLLLAYLTVIPGVFPAAIVAVAALHGGHEASITTAHGDWDVVLQHHDDARAEGHEHRPHSGDGGVEAEDDHHHGSDHVFHFSAASHASTRAACFVPAALPVLLPPETISVPERVRCLVPDCLETVLARPPPGRPALLMCLRTIVLIV